MSDAETLAVYAAHAAAYAEKTDAFNISDPLLAAFIADIPAGGHVLDLGCGPGASAAVMARAGLRVTATDATPEMVARAARHDGVTARQATFDEIDGMDVYDGIWANFSLLHAPRADLPRHFAALKTALNTGGCLHVAFKTGDGERRDGLGRRYTYVTEAELRQMVQAAGFVVTDQARGTGTGLDGTPADWVALAANG